MKNTTDFAQLVTKFLTDYLPMKRNYSKNTIWSYKDTFKLFATYLVEVKEINLGNYTMQEFNKDIIIEFLEWLRERGNSINTTNQRLAAIKTFAYFAQVEDIEHIAGLQKINQIKSKKTQSREIKFLTVEQMSKLINLPNSNRKIELKHKVVLCLLYDTGARVQEICDLTIGDIILGNHPKIRLCGKGNKIRTVPITSNMNELLEEYMDAFRYQQTLRDRYLIQNIHNNKMSRDGVEYIIKKYASIASEEDPTFPSKVHPHMFRHSKAMHMLAADIPIVYIRDFLGHEDISTTMIYARADTTLKEAAINKLAPKIIEAEDYPDWTRDKDLLDFLKKFK